MENFWPRRNTQSSISRLCDFRIKQKPMWSVLIWVVMPIAKKSPWVRFSTIWSINDQTLSSWIVGQVSSTAYSIRPIIWFAKKIILCRWAILSPIRRIGEGYDCHRFDGSGLLFPVTIVSDGDEHSRLMFRRGCLIVLVCPKNYFTCSLWKLLERSISWKGPFCTQTKSQRWAKPTPIK